MGFFERRRGRVKNQLPKHLRPLPRWPIYLQMALNLAIAITLSTLMINQDDYLTDAGPAVGMVVCLLFLIYTLISAFQMRHRYEKTKEHRLTVINLWLMGIAFLMFPICVGTFLR